MSVYILSDLCFTSNVRLTSHQSHHPSSFDSEILEQQKCEYEQKRMESVFPIVPNPIGVPEDDESMSQRLRPEVGLQAPPPPRGFWVKYYDRISHSPSSPSPSPSHVAAGQAVVQAASTPSTTIIPHGRPSLSMSLDDSSASFTTSSTLLSPTGRAG